jgi:hypothetical protein
MAAAQPANTEIQVFRRVRVQAINDRHDSLKQMGRLRSKYVVVPAEEIRVLSTQDDVVTDAWRYGHPVVRYSREAKEVQTVYDNVSDLEMPVRLTVDRREFQIEKTSDAVGDDLFQETRDA